jgi:hypothetical protein
MFFGRDLRHLLLTIALVFQTALVRSLSQNRPTQRLRPTFEGVNAGLAGGCCVQRFKDGLIHIDEVFLRSLISQTLVGLRHHERRQIGRACFDMLEALLLKRNDSRHFYLVVGDIRTVLTVLPPLFIRLFMARLSLHIGLTIDDSLGHPEVLIVDFSRLLLLKRQVQRVLDRGLVPGPPLLLGKRFEVDDG